MINFEDLSVEDKERILEQAKQIVEEENLQKNAKAMYSIKKKELVDNYIDVINSVFKIKKYSPEHRAIETRYKSMINYLYKIKVFGKQHAESINNNTQIITCEKEWNLYKEIANTMKDAVINCYKGES